MPEFDVIVEWSAEDGVFVADVPELPGCMAHGETTESAIAHAREAMSLWIETAIEFGREVPEAAREQPASCSRLTVESEPDLRVDLGMDS